MILKQMLFNTKNQELLSQFCDLRFEGKIRKNNLDFEVNVNLSEANYCLIIIYLTSIIQDSV